MKRLWWIVSGVVALGVIVAVGLILGPKNPIPGPIRLQLTSTLILPQGSEVVIDRQSAKYDTKQKLLSFQVSYAGVKMVVSEQPTPEQFIDVPDVYTKLIDGLGRYSSFDVNVGTVNLTMPKQLSGKQAAVMNAKGTLMFVKPDKNLTSDQWRTLFNGMRVAS